MNPEGLVQKKTSGKDQLSVKDISARSGMDESYIRKCIKHGFLKPSHFSSKFAVDGVELNAHDKERVDKHIESIKARKGSGFTSEKAMKEVATAQVIEENKLEGRPTNFKWKEFSAEEIFDNFWKGPSGERRMVNPGKLRGEIANMERGGSWYDAPMNLHGMPDNYDSILWDKTKEEAARLHVLSLTGDEEAAERYRKLQAKFPEQLPKLEEVKKK